MRGVVTNMSLEDLTELNEEKRHARHVRGSTLLWEGVHYESGEGLALLLRKDRASATIVSLQTKKDGKQVFGVPIRNNEEWEVTKKFGTHLAATYAAGTWTKDQLVEKRSSFYAQLDPADSDGSSSSSASD